MTNAAPRRLRLLALAALLGFFLPVMSCARHGERVMAREGCLKCHTFKGRGGHIGPDLTSVTSRRTDDWIVDQIRNSKKHNPRSRMPSFSHLSFLEIRSILAHLKS